MKSIAFVGAGPTTLYTLQALLAHPSPKARIVVFEAEAQAGSGSPYRPEWNDGAMLSNIASVEIPPVAQTLLEWAQALPDQTVRDLGIDFADLHERAFLPRIALGRYFQDQFAQLVRAATAAGWDITVRTRCRVIDVANRPEGIDLTWSGGAGTTSARFDHVVLATGHQWPWKQEARPGYFASPWPAATLAQIPATAVGVRGSSLTAIDAAVALATTHGAFVREGDRLDYRPAPGTEAFRMTLMSRKGLLPEADFYFPLPHPPLAICTTQAIQGLIDAGGADLLDRVFDLFRREMMRVDPEYAAATGLETASLEAFSEAYFAPRAAVNPFAWAASNLAEARANHATRTTIPWRDALLRMHEPIAAIAPRLDGAQFRRFARFFKPVFVDAYGAVPHESIERILALHRAGKIEVLALGDRYAIDTRPPEGGARLVKDGVVRRFPVFIEATGQRVLGAIQFPFLSLIEQGIVRDAEPGDAEDEDPGRGIEIDDQFSLTGAGLPADRLFCLSLPFIMGRHPFAQGVTSSHDMGQIVGRRLAAVLARERTPVDTLRAVA